MLIGNKKTIAFEYINVADSLAHVNFYLENRNLTEIANGHYYLLLVNRIKHDLRQLKNSDLTLKDIYKICTLPELYNLLEKGEQIHYQEHQLHCFDYDISTTHGYFYVYQSVDDLIFFGKINNEYDLLSSKISKYKYREILNELLSELQKVNPTI